MPEEAAPVRPGEIIDGRYRVERMLGQGGMAVVVAARHEGLDELVAIKIVLPERLQSPEVRERFTREARAAVKIKSEHVARVMDVGELPDGTPYMVMEHLDGEDLAKRLAREGKVGVTTAVDWGLQICEGLEAAHALGVIHRDVKPANLYLAKVRGETILKVLDFGISKAERLDRRRTETKEILGSPWYMAPEQLKSATSADVRSDIWSLGVILYELVTGEVPFDGDSMTEVIVKVLHEQVPLGKLPKALEPIVRKCLAKAPQARYDSMTEVASALRRVLESGSSPSLLDVMTPSPRPVRHRLRTPSVAIPPPAAGSGSHEIVESSEVELLSVARIPLDGARPDDTIELGDEAELLPSDPPSAAVMLSSKPPPDSSVIELDEADVDAAPPSTDDAETPYVPAVASDEAETPYMPPVAELINEKTASSLLAASAPPEPMLQGKTPPPPGIALETTTAANGSKPPAGTSARLAASFSPMALQGRASSSKPPSPSPVIPETPLVLADEEEPLPPPSALAASAPPPVSAVARLEAEIEIPRPSAVPSVPSVALPAEDIDGDDVEDAPVSAPPSSRPAEVVSASAVEDDEDDEPSKKPAVAPSTKPARAVEPAARGGSSWIVVAAVVVLGGGVLYAMRANGPPSAPTAASAEPSAKASAEEPDPPVIVGTSTPTASASASESPVLVGSAAIASVTPPSSMQPMIVVPPTSVESPSKPAPAKAATSHEPAEDEANVPFDIARKNHGALRAACWDASEKTTPLVSVSVTVDGAGAVTAASATSADAKLAQCVEGQVRHWSFPASKSGTRTYRVPIHFRR